MKNKFKIAALALGSLGFLACLTNGKVSNLVNNPYLNEDTTFLVNIGGTVKDLGKEGVKQSQNEFINDLRSKIGYNFTVLDTLDAINVVKIKANNQLKEVIESAKNATFVAENAAYRFGDVYSGKETEAELSEGYIRNQDSGVKALDDDDANENQSGENMNVPENNNGGAGSFIAILDSGFYMQHHAFANLEGLGREKARFHYNDLKAVSSDLDGAPSKIYENVTDDFTGEEADGSTYFNLKIPYYYDYGASSSNSSNDYDVLSRVSEHGTHVASITAANGTYKGIAPNTQLALMKVFYEILPSGNSGGGTYAKDEDILEALNDSLVLGVDAINMSLGSDLDEFDNRSASMQKLTELANNGINCNISAGNGGKGLFSSMSTYSDWALSETETGVLGSYACSTSSNIVASNTTEELYYEKAIQFGDSLVAYSDQVDYSDGSDGITEANEKLFAKELAGIENLQFVTAGVPDDEGHLYGQDSDYSKVTAVDKNYFRNKVAVCDRGNTTFIAKATAAYDAGAAALLVINNDPTAYEFNFGMSWSNDGTYSIPKIPVIFVLYRDRDTILKNTLTSALLDTNGEVVCNYGNGEIIVDTPANNPDKYKMSDFSSEGSTGNLDIIPTISAPGTSIKGATLGTANSKGYVEELDPDKYEYLNGTSMASPNFSGICALLVGEQDFANDEERIAYNKSIAMRTMSTATQYLATSTMYDDIKSSIAYKESDTEHKNPITIYTPETAVEETAEYSPRKQGAGIVNAAAAINSNVYLEGLEVNDDGSFSSKGNGFAKIELRNNDLVKNGTIKLGARLHKVGGGDMTYKATMTIMTSQVSGYHNHDNELANYATTDVKFEGAKIQTQFDRYLAKEVEIGQVTLSGDETVKDVTFNPYTLNDEQKAYMANFPNGGYLEGYLTLTPVGSEVSDENPALKAPYMGFYGDFAQADAIEPFDFEKEAEYDRRTYDDDTPEEEKGTVYGSDLINYVGNRSYGLNNIDQSSTIVAASFDDFQTYDRKSSVYDNSESLNNFGKQIVTSYDEENDRYTLYVGGEETDVLYIQNFVYRSLSSVKMTLRDVRNTKVVDSSVQDIINNKENLFKSHISASYISNKSLTHRGYTELPLYDANGVKLPNGTYTLTFTYTLISGAVQTKTYNLVIDAVTPKVTYRAILDVNGEKVLRLKLNEIYIPSKRYVHVNSDQTEFSINKVSDGYIIDIPLKDAFINGKLFFDVNDATLNNYVFMMNESEVGEGLVISSSTLTNGSSYQYTRSVYDSEKALSYMYEISALDYYGNDLDLKEFEATITLPTKLGNFTKVYEVSASGVKTEINSFYKLDNSTIVVKTTSKKILVEDSGAKGTLINADNATVTYTEVYEKGKVYVSKVSGASGDLVTVYAIANEGYEVEFVKVNGVNITQDANGNYTFVLAAGENVVEVSFF